MTSRKINCPDCGAGPMEYRKGRFGMFYGCPRYPTCKGVFSGAATATPANKETRDLRIKCHEIVDALWQRERGGTINRKGVYRLISKLMELPKEKTHVGMFDADQCRALLERLPAYLAKLSAGELLFHHLRLIDIKRRVDRPENEMPSWVEAARVEMDRRDNKASAMAGSKA